MSQRESPPVRPLDLLGTFDRLTLYLWRALNIVGWGLVGAFIAVEVHWVVVQSVGFEQSAAFHRDFGSPPELGWGFTARILAWRLIIALIAAVAIGVLAGRRAWTKQGLIAALAALAYGLYALVALEHDQAASAQIMLHVGIDSVEPNPVWLTILHDAFILTVVPMSYAIARRTAGSREQSAEDDVTQV